MPWSNDLIANCQSIMHLCVLLVTTVLIAASATNSTEKVLSRHKRYLTFPEGSTYSFAFCMELKTISEDYDLYSEGVAVAANYDLPSKPELLFTTKERLPHQVLQRRHRRDIYGQLEKILNLAGLDGRSCMLLALCETAQKLTPGVGMIEELVRIMFTIPVEHLSRHEPREHWHYTTAYKSGIQNLNCQQLYPRCPLSLLAVIMDMKPSNLFYH